MDKRRTESKAVEGTLQKPDVHAKWEHDFRAPENARFYDDAMRFIARELDPSVRPKLLDAGCGICDYSIRLAEEGFDVTAVDLAEDVLEAARANIRRQGLEGSVVVNRENLTSLSIPDESFDSILCWGVLMHIPDVEAATAELARVLKPGGRLAVSETNMRSLEGVTLRWVRRLLGRGAERVQRTPAGVEHWTQSSAGPLVTRESDIHWLVGRFRELGLVLRTRVAGQLSESYVRVDSRAAKQAIHSINTAWFEHVRWAGPAVGNILVLEREGDR